MEQEQAQTEVLLCTPPFTQLNTPYPATAYLKGFLNTKNISSAQIDLGMDVILEIFSKRGLTRVFDIAEAYEDELSENADRIISLREAYIEKIEPVVLLLQNKNHNFAHRIARGNFLPQASRFHGIAEALETFGTGGIADRAKYLATLFLEDIGDLISECVDPHFGFSRYAERLSRSASSFDELYAELQKPLGFVDEISADILAEKLRSCKPKLLALSAPFPGNVYGAFRCAQMVREQFPEVKICLGGGFANTELRSISDPRVFSFVDFICLDDGEAPLLAVLDHIQGKIPAAFLKRTFVCEEGKVAFHNGSLLPDPNQKFVGTPDYSGLQLDKYIQVIEIANPMHRLWSDGQWNKLTLAHGCYWGKCTFCDISLSYIADYEASPASLIVDRMETLIAQTGNSGFHFVDEAAPPALMRDVALEILKRKLSVVWWTNIRFEKSFSADLCALLAASGCIAVSGGLEVASDRLLQLIKKGVTVAQVARVTENFSHAGIMVHAYLMYGFPTQSAQETIDSLEVVRQLFMHGLVQSGFWHQFAMTAHSPVGLDPAAFGVKNKSVIPGTFANNDLEHEDPSGARHEQFSEGLRKSLFNFMHNRCFDFRLQEWFDFKVPKTTISPNYIKDILAQDQETQLRDTDKLVWIGVRPVIYEAEERGKAVFILNDNEGTEASIIDKELAIWLRAQLDESSPGSAMRSIAMWRESYQTKFRKDFDALAVTPIFRELRAAGLLKL